LRKSPKIVAEFADDDVVLAPTLVDAIDHADALEQRQLPSEMPLARRGARDARGERRTAVLSGACPERAEGTHAPSYAPAATSSTPPPVIAPGCGDL
jgi:hypothetical protein